jgi:hypothetical protein
VTTSQPAAIKPGGVEVPEVVQREVGDLSAPAGLAPLVPDGVLVRRQSGGGLEGPPGTAPTRAVPGDVLGQQLEQAVGEVHHALAAVLRRSDLDGACSGTLDLPSDGEGATQEVDVADLKTGSLTEAQAGERGERDEAR